MTIAVKLKPEVAARFKASDAHVIVTGATGWLGRALVHAFADALGGDLARLHVFGSKESTMVLDGGTTLASLPLATLGDLPRAQDYYVFHFAFLTKDKQSNMPLEEYTATNHAICETVGKMLETHRVKGLCVTSSGAVYKSGTEELNEDRIKYPYAALKVEEEKYFRTLCKKNNIPLLIPRIFNVGGPYINKWQAYALSSLLAMALSGEPLVIAAKHPVIRSYVAIENILQMLTAWLMRPEAEGELTFDIASPDTVEIGKLAEAICDISGRNISDIVRIFDASLPADRYLGDSIVFLKLCNEFGITPLKLDEQIRQTMEYMQSVTQTGKAT